MGEQGKVLKPHLLSGGGKKKETEKLTIFNFGSKLPSPPLSVHVLKLFLYVASQKTFIV